MEHWYVIHRFIDDTIYVFGKYIFFFFHLQKFAINRRWLWNLYLRLFVWSTTTKILTSLLEEATMDRSVGFYYEYELHMNDIYREICLFPFIRHICASSAMLKYLQSTMCLPLIADITDVCLKSQLKMYLRKGTQMFSSQRVCLISRLLGHSEWQPASTDVRHWA